jgi:hypothetical protein
MLYTRTVLRSTKVEYTCICCVHRISHYLKSSQNVQNVLPAPQMLAFFAQIAYFAQNKHLHLAPILGQSTGNDVSTYMNWTWPRILYFTGFGPRTERNLSFSTTLFFHTPHDLLASYDWPALSMRFQPLFFTGAPWPSVGAPGHWLEHWITFAVGRLEHPFSFFFFFTIVSPVLLLFSLSF